MFRQRLQAEKQNLSASPESDALEQQWLQDMTAASKIFQPDHFDEGTILHRSKLLRALKNTPLDPNVWLDYLNLLDDQRKRTIRSGTNKETRDDMYHSMVRLYQTATTVIPMSAANRHSPAYLRVWLNKATLHAEVAEDGYLARDVFKTLKLQRIGITLPTFWNAWADLEKALGNPGKAEKLRGQAAVRAAGSTPPPSEPRSLIPDNNSARAPRRLPVRPPLRVVPTPQQQPRYPGQDAPPLATSTPMQAQRAPYSQPPDDDSPEKHRRATPRATDFEPPHLLSPERVDPQNLRIPVGPPGQVANEPQARPSFAVNQLHGNPSSAFQESNRPEPAHPTPAERHDVPMHEREDYSPNPGVVPGQPKQSSAPPSSTSSTSGSRQTDSFGDVVAPSEKRRHKRTPNRDVPVKLHPFFSQMSPNDLTVVNGNQYLLLGLVGKGGSSKVYKVLNISRTVLALKRIQVPRSSPNFKPTLESYANEIELLKKLRGAKHIVRCFDAEVREDRGLIQIVMEHGETDLAKRLADKDSKRRNQVFRKSYWQEMLEAVNTIHEAKIVHGDLKPANFLFVEGSLKLIDFGIAKAIQTEDTTKIFRDVQVGTPNYMSPEALVAYDGDEDSADMCDVGQHASSKPKYRVGRASDIWSLGCILYQMICGQTPFAHLSNMMQKLACIQDPKYDIQYDRVKNPVALDVLQGCLQRDPVKRMSIPDLLNHGFLTDDDPFQAGERAGAREIATSAIDLQKLGRDFLEGLEDLRYEIRTESGMKVQYRRGDMRFERYFETFVRDYVDVRNRAQQAEGKTRSRNMMTPTTSGVTQGSRLYPSSSTKSGDRL